MLENTPDILTRKEMQQLLHIGKNSALSLLNNNIITGHKSNGQWLIFKEDIIEYLLRA